MTKENRTAAISIRVPDSIKEKITTIAWENKRTLNDLLNEIISHYIKEKQNEKH